jgi:hypothetical protein
MKHARLSPSSASRWTVCTASPAASDGLPNVGNDASRFGTCGHQVHEEMLLHPERDLLSYLGRKLVFWVHPESDSSGECWADEIGPNPDPCLEFVAEQEVTEEMLDGVAASLNFVQEMVDMHGGELLVEQRVPIGHITGEGGAKGSADVLLLTPKVLRCFDLKMGRHRVYASEVVRPAGKCPVTGVFQPEIRRPNLQLAFYALGALHEHDLLYDFEYVHLAIIQPMLGHVDEFRCTVEELREVETYLRDKAIEVRTNPQFRPSASTCHFCLRSGNCEAQAKAVLETALDGFEDVDTAKPAPIKVNTLGSLYAALPMIKGWCEAVEARTRQALLAGEPVVRNDGLAYKLIDGRATKRTWTDEAEAEASLLSIAPPERVYQPRKVISPAQAEILSKSKRPPKGQPKIPPVVTAEQWASVQHLITQGQAQPSIVLETDPHPALSSVTDGFEDVPDSTPNLKD